MLRRLSATIATARSKRSHASGSNSISFVGHFAMLPPLKSISNIAETDLFAASYVKLARAQHFIAELEAELKRYQNSDPVSARLDHTANPPALQVEWKGVTLLPGAIVGDAIHNL